MFVICTDGRRGEYNKWWLRARKHEKPNGKNPCLNHQNGMHKLAAEERILMSVFFFVYVNAFLFYTLTCFLHRSNNWKRSCDDQKRKEWQCNYLACNCVSLFRVSIYLFHFGTKAKNKKKTHSLGEYNRFVTKSSFRQECMANELHVRCLCSIFLDVLLLY